MPDHVDKTINPGDSQIKASNKNVGRNNEGVTHNSFLPLPSLRPFLIKVCIFVALKSNVKKYESSRVLEHHYRNISECDVQ